MPDALFSIESAFSIDGRGVCLDTGVSVDRSCPIREGQYLLLKVPGGTDIKVSVRSIGFFVRSTSPPRENYAIMLREPDINPKDIPAGTEAFELDDSWRRSAISEPIVWTGDLDDDCTARWAGLVLRAEEMDRGFWWWCVYDKERRNLEIASSNETEVACRTGVEARRLAEEAAREYLEPIARKRKG